MMTENIKASSREFLKKIIRGGLQAFSEKVSAHNDRKPEGLGSTTDWNKPMSQMISECFAG